MQRRRCKACGHAFRPRPQVPQQRYCPAKACQRYRRRSWQTARREADPDYRDNQARAQRAWLERNPDYWRGYRRTHPQYSERNRLLQRDRNGRRRRTPIAKMDASADGVPLLSGLYQISPVRPCLDCKDGRVNGAIRYAISPIRAVGDVLQREDPIGPGKPRCYRGAF